jgi:hypothetical protein
LPITAAVQAMPGGRRFEMADRPGPRDNRAGAGADQHSESFAWPPTATSMTCSQLKASRVARTTSMLSLLQPPQQLPVPRGVGVTWISVVLDWT